MTRCNHDQMAEWIDNASYGELLEKWRFAPSGSMWFIGSIGQYYQKIMLEKRSAIGPDAATKESKRLG